MLAGLLYLLLFGFLILRLPFFRNSGLSFRVLGAAFGLRVLAGMLYWYLYLYYPSWQGTSDAWIFFTDSKHLYAALWQHPMDYLRMITGIGDNHPHFAQYYEKMAYWERAWDHGLFNDNRTMIRVNALFRLISGGYYPVHILFSGFLSFAGLTALYRVFSRGLQEEPAKGKKEPAGQERRKKRILTVGVLFLPSVVFWGSGASKEAISLAATGFFLFYGIRWMEDGFRQKSGLAVFLPALALMCFLKMYILALLLPLLLAWFWDTRFAKPATGWKYTWVLLASLCMIFLMRWFIPEYNLHDLLAAKQKDFYATVIEQNEEALSNIPSLGDHSLRVVEAIPVAFLNSLASPFYLMHVNALTLMALAENILIVLLFLYALVSWSPQENQSRLFWFCAGFFLLYFILIGMISPLPGAIHRYRIMALPFLAALAVSGRKKSQK